MLVLGIESTCDETACSIVRDGKEIISNVISSQIDLHREYGGVVPELACRRHIDILIPVIDEAVKEAGIELADVDLIAVARGPGLIGALLIGLNAAKALSFTLGKPLIGVNHIEAHLYACVMSHPTPIAHPCLGVVISGGHTSLVRMDDLGCYSLIGQTIDDAIGEAFDKVARMLGLPYPGGPNIEKLALKGDPHSFPFKAGMVKGRPLDFSFSGLKTAVLYAVKGKNPEELIPADVAASFQRAALNDIVTKARRAASEHGCQGILLGGGVSNNRRLRVLFDEAKLDIPVFWPSAGLSLDNAAMIAGLGYHQYQRRGADTLALEALTRIAW